MVCHDLNVEAKAKLAKELHLLITIKLTLAHNKSKQKNETNLATIIISFKINVTRTLDILPNLRELKIRS